MFVKVDKGFLCEGTIYRHTKASWDEAPMEFKQAHHVRASTTQRVTAVKYENKVEDLTAFDCEVYWKTIWCKCESCHERHCQFRSWVATENYLLGASIM